MKPSVAPRRLMDAEGPTADLLRAATREYRVSLNADSAWRTHRERRARGAWLRVALVGVACSAAFGWLVLARHSQARLPDLLARAEPQAARPAQRVEPLASPLASPTPQLGLARERAAVSKAQRAVAVPAEHAAPELAAPALALSGSQSLASAAPATPADCLADARAGNARAAEHCFEAQATGQGLSAEVALYELARLRRDMLGAPASALSALDDYVQRFPHGNLSGEVRFSRLELLVKLGRNAEALRASDELLASPSGKERAPEVRLLRGNVFAHALGDPGNAAREYAAAALAPGRVGDDAAFLQAVSLAKAGDKAQASSAFERYLARSGGRHRAEAQARLNELANSAAERGE